MRIVDWITWTDAEDKEEHGFGGMGGWFKDGMRWIDYKACVPLEYQEQVEHLRSQILARKIRCAGDEHQGCGTAEVAAVPLWEDGTVDTYSMRAWGDLMAAVWSTEDDRDYSYLNFYMKDWNMPGQKKETKT